MVLSSFMVSLTELSHVASVASVVICCLLMLGFLLRLCGQDMLNGGMAWNEEHAHNIISRLFSSLTPNSTNLCPIELFVGVTKVSASDSGTTVTFRLRTSGTRSVRIRPYWGVSVSIFHHVLKSPWPWFKEAFLRGNLFGSKGCSMLGDIQTCSSDCLKGDPLGATGQFPKRRIIVKMVKPDGKPMEDLGPAPRQIYPLVVVILPGDDDFYSNSQEGNVGAFIERKKQKRNICVVCQELPVTRCTLPCKHACTCQRCFKRLSSRCPMCRTLIASYFLVGDESDKAIAEAEARDKAEEEERLRNRPRTIAQRLGEFNDRFARAAGLLEN